MRNGETFHSTAPSILLIVRNRGHVGELGASNHPKGVLEGVSRFLILLLALAILVRKIRIERIEMEKKNA